MKWKANNKTLNEYGQLRYVHGPKVDAPVQSGAGGATTRSNDNVRRKSRRKHAKENARSATKHVPTTTKSKLLCQCPNTKLRLAFRDGNLIVRVFNYRKSIGKEPRFWIVCSFSLFEVPRLVSMERRRCVCDRQWQRQFDFLTPENRRVIFE